MMKNFLTMWLCAMVFPAVAVRAFSMHHANPESEDSIVFEGRVVNSKGIPIKGTVLQGITTGISVTTGADGFFHLVFPTQNESVTATKEGLASFKAFISYSYKGAIVMTESKSEWLSYSDYVKRVRPTAKIYYEAGLKYQDGENGELPDLRNAIACFYRAASMEYPPAIYQMGRMYDEGIGLKQNHKEAAAWYLKTDSCAEALTRLGEMYEKGIGVKQDYVAAFAKYHRAVELGDSHVALSHKKRLLDQGLVKEEDIGLIYQIVERNPEFPGGNEGLMQWLFSNLRYPASAQEQCIMGTVYVIFVIECDGSITDVRVYKSPDISLANEAVRVVKLMPRWKPGYQRGKPVRVRYTMPIHFRLI